MANFITSCRIICSIMLLFISSLSKAFNILYLIAGFIDMIDGTVARKTNTVSEFGSKLDTVADFIFVVVCFIKFLPLWDMPTWIWVWVGIIAVIKIINIASGFVVHKKLVAEHSAMNKIAGLMLFILPLTLSIIDLKYSAIAVSTVATFAAIQEGYDIRAERNSVKK